MNLLCLFFFSLSCFRKGFYGGGGKSLPAVPGVREVRVISIFIFLVHAVGVTT